MATAAFIPLELAPTGALLTHILLGHNSLVVITNSMVSHFSSACTNNRDEVMTTTENAAVRDDLRYPFVARERHLHAAYQDHIPREADTVADVRSSCALCCKAIWSGAGKIRRRKPKTGLIACCLFSYEVQQPMHLKCGMHLQAISGDRRNQSG